MQKLFAIILSVSLSLNAYLFFKLKAEPAVLSDTKKRSDDQIRNDVDKPDTYLKVNNEQRNEATHDLV
jgi:hypothetical protein